MAFDGRAFVGALCERWLVTALNSIEDAIHSAFWYLVMLICWEYDIIHKKYML